MGRQSHNYISNAQKTVTIEGIEQYHQLREIVDRITQINLALLKENRNRQFSEIRALGLVWGGYFTILGGHWMAIRRIIQPTTNC